MIHVVGGVYEERCLQPHWFQLYGSGGRAAAALAPRLQKGVVLTTYVGDGWRRNLEARALQSGFGLQLRPVPSTIIFSYVHPLSVPVIHPPPHLIPRAETIDCEGPVVLRFGMIEGDARVRGKRVVYDPQSATNPEFFRSNGSTAEELAVVANAYEVRLLSGKDEPEAGAREIVARDGAAVVVVKRGSRGALVISGTSVNEVPAYKTDHVFSIGSGDIFAAAFVFFWGEQQLAPADAADLASKATARYCESQVAETCLGSELLSAVMTPVKPSQGRAYLAGPFFTLPQRWLVEEARFHLRSMDVDVFSPVHDVGPGPAAEVAPADLEGLQRCDRVLALVDGADTGTLFEVGYARARGLPVIALAETLTDEQQKMLLGSGCTVTTDFVTAIYKTSWL